VAAPADSGSIDFEFDLGTPAAAAAEPAVSLDLPTPEPVGLDLGSISLELDTPAAAVEAAAAPAAGDVADNPEVATKIELAMAYEEMGDRDGARELFQEALAEGSPAQQQVARAKLDSLG
jgi:pilus assembly protein FimV